MRKIFIARNAKNTLNINPCPIIFVPGVMGTRLQLPGEDGAFSWDPDRALAMKDLYAADSQTKRALFDSKKNAVILKDDRYGLEGVTDFNVWGRIFERDQRQKNSEVAI